MTRESANWNIQSFCTIFIPETRQTIMTFINHTENQVRLNYVKHRQTKSNNNTTASLMQQADIRDNYPLWTSQATILKNISKSYLERNVTQDARSWKRPQCPQVKKANQLIKQQMKIYIYSRRKARGITCKLTSISRRHGIFILIQSIIYF